MSGTLPEDWRDWPDDRKHAFLERLRCARLGRSVARPAQRPPPRDWYIWALVGGRGSGKTRSGVEWLAEELLCEPRGAESAIVAPTFADASDTCVEGPSGPMGALERRGIAVAAWNRSLGELRLTSGAVLRHRRRRRRRAVPAGPQLPPSLLQRARSVAGARGRAGTGRSRCFRPCASASPGL